MSQPLRLVRDEPEKPTLPNFALETQVQVDEAMALLSEDTRNCPRVPWSELDEALGPLRPWNWWTVAAHFAQGKTTILMSLVAHWVSQGRPVYMLPLETAPDVMRSNLAAIRSGLDTGKVLAGQWDQLPGDAVRRIADDMTWQQSKEGQRLLYFNRLAEVGVSELRVAMMEAEVFGAEVFIVDHIHHLDTGAGNGFHGFKVLCQTLNELAKEYRIPIITTAQMHRGERDRVARHMPPNPMSIQGGDTLGQYGHVIVGAYRPFAGKLSRIDEGMVRKGDGGEIRKYLEPNCVGFHVMKHRILGEQAGRIVKLRYEAGRIVEPTWEQRERWRQQELAAPE